MTTQVPIKGLRGAVILHRCLVAGLVTMAGVIAVLAFKGIAPLLGPDGTASLISRIMAGVSVCEMAVALLIFRPRMPVFERRYAQETYWDSPGALKAAQMVWFFLDGAAITSLVAFLLSGESVTAVVAAVAIVAMLVSGPDRLARS